MNLTPSVVLLLHSYDTLEANSLSDPLVAHRRKRHSELGNSPSKTRCAYVQMGKYYLFFHSFAAFAVVGFTAGERVREGCISDPIVLPLPPQCGTLTDISLGFLGFGVILTWSLLFLHYLVAATRRSWGWIVTFFVVPPVCFLFSAFGVNPPGARADLLPSLVYLPIGLPNLLFGIFALKARPGAAKKLSGS